MRLRSYLVHPRGTVLTAAVLASVFAAASLLSCSSHEQSPPAVATWARTYAPELGELKEVRPATDGGHLALGFFGVIVKLNSMGDVVWAKMYVGGDQTTFTSVHALPDGGWLVAGNIRNGSAEPRDSRPLVLRLDNLGNILWQRTYHASSFDVLADAALDRGNGLVVTGTSRFASGSLSTFAHWIARLDENGSVLWANTYTGFASSKLLHVTDDGGLVVMGGDPAAAYRPGPALVRLDRFGTPVWLKELVSGLPYILDARKTVDGGTILLSETALEDGLVVTKLNSVGGIDWQKTYRGPTKDEADVWGHGVLPGSDGGYVVVTKATEASGESLGLLLKIDATGGIDWQRTYDGLPDLLYANGIDAAEDGGYVLSASSRDGWQIAKVDSGGQIAGCRPRDLSTLTMASSRAEETAGTVPAASPIGLLVESAAVVVTNVNVGGFGACRPLAK